MCHTSECGCGQPTHHAPLAATHPHGNCCCMQGYPPRHFPTREELIRELEGYLSHLQSEAKGVEERIADLRKG